MSDDKESKTEQPTPKKLKDGRKEGQVPRTPDLGTWLGVAAAAATLPWSSRLLAEEVRTAMAALPDVARDPTPARALAALSQVPMDVVLASAPATVAATAGALLGTVAQGVFPSGKAIKPKFSRMSPLQGVKRMFGPRAAWEAVKALLKVTAISVVLLVLARQLVPSLVGSGTAPLAATLDTLHRGMQTLLWTVALTGLVIAGADWAHSRHEVMKQLRMTPHEVKQEHKQSEGDPLIKASVRSKQMAMSRNRMLAAVGEADVVLVNPTHYAVAMRYEAQRGAPRVVAKGTDALAAKIRERAREARVPVVEDPPLARLLHRVCDVDDEIPAELYLAVARILAFVMAAGKPTRTATARRPSTPAVTLPALPSKVALRRRRTTEHRDDRRTARTG